MGDGPGDVGAGVECNGLGVAEAVGEGEWLTDGDGLGDRVGLGAEYVGLGVLAVEVGFVPGWVDPLDVDGGLTQA